MAAEALTSISIAPDGMHTELQGMNTYLHFSITKDYDRALKFFLTSEHFLISYA